MRILVIVFLFFITSSISTMGSYLSPTALVCIEGKRLLIVAQKTANRIDFIDMKSYRIKNSVKLKHSPGGICLSSNKNLLFVTAGEAEGMLYLIDLNTEKIKSVIKIGHSPCSPVLVSNNKLAFCNRFANQVSFLDLQTKIIIKTVNTSREPISIDFDEKRKQLVVAHHLPDDASTSDEVSAEISFIDTEKMELIKHVSMPNGSSSLKQIKVEPNGRYAVVSHILSRYIVHTTQLEQGWQNTNAITLIDLEKQNIYHTVLLDDVQHGAANPWGVEFDNDGKTLYVTSAGTGEVSIINFPKLQVKLMKYSSLSGHSAQLNDPGNKLSFINDCRERFGLKGEGPRCLATGNSRLFVGQYFSDAIEVVDFSSSRLTSQLVRLNKLEPDMARKGEMLFHSAKMCFENWQSCSSCHPDGRVDGFNWDLLNDGIGNPKNVLSLLYSFKTPPSMSTGIRENAGMAVRAGMKYILFMDLNENDAQTIDTFLIRMRPVPSPYLVDGELSESAQKGKAIFEKSGCTHCHNGIYLTNQKMYDVRTNSKFDFMIDSENKVMPQKLFDTPSLIELWRTAPYLHDGRYYTIEELFEKGYHGNVKMGNDGLSGREVSQLSDYLRSL